MASFFPKQSDNESHYATLYEECMDAALWAPGHWDWIMEISSSKSEITTSRIHNELKIIGNLGPVKNASAAASSIYILNFKTNSIVKKE